MAFTVLPRAGIGMPVGMVSPLELIKTRSLLPSPNFTFLSWLWSTGKVGRFSGILCRLGWAFLMVNCEWLMINDLGFETLSGWMILGVAGMGIPVFKVSPNELMMGSMLLPVTGFMA